MATDVSDLSPESIETNIDEATANKNIVHIRIQQRKKTKAVTIVQGLPPKLKLEQVMKYFKKTFCTNGSIIEDPSYGRILQVQGDQRRPIAEFLVQQKIVTQDQIRIHGT